MESGKSKEVAKLDMKQVEGFYYYQDEKHATVLIVDYLRHYVQKIMNCPPCECMNDEAMEYISVDTATIMLPPPLIMEYKTDTKAKYCHTGFANNKRRKSLCFSLFMF